MISQYKKVSTEIEFPATEKVRSILQLQKALREESYENCAFWVDRAVLSGATKREISWVLRHPEWNIEEVSSLN